VHRPSIAFLNGRYVIVGSSGTAYSTDGGYTWTKATSKAESNSSVYVAGNSGFMYVGASSVAYSADGLTWTNDSVLMAGSMYDSTVATNGSTIVVSKISGSLIVFQRSTNNGTSWEGSTSASHGATTIGDIPIIYAGSLGFIHAYSDVSGVTPCPLVMFANPTGSTSTWTKYTLSFSTSPNQNRSPKEIVYHPATQKVFVSSNWSSPEICYFTSLSGPVTSISLSSQLSSSPQVISESATRGLVTGFNSLLATQTTNMEAVISYNDGVTWTAVTYRGVSGVSRFVPGVLKAYQINSANVTVTPVATKKFKHSIMTANVTVTPQILKKAKKQISSSVSVSVSNTKKVMKFITKNVVVNTPTVLQKFWGNAWSMVYASTKWIGVKFNSNKSAYSSDGANWTTVSLPSTDKWCSLALGATTAITLAPDSTQVLTTTDGITWTQRSLATPRLWKSIAANGSTFTAVALQSNKAVTTVNNGVTWTEYDLPTNSNWTSVCYGNGLFVAVCDSGIAATSTDGITWTSRAMPDKLQFNGVTWALNQFTAVASGPTNLAAKSTDGITWTRITMPVSDNWTSVGPGVGDPNV
jgi:hypothetical protein